MDVDFLKASFLEMSDIFLKINSQLWNLFCVAITEITTSLVRISKVVLACMTLELGRGGWTNTGRKLVVPAEGVQCRSLFELFNEVVLLRGDLCR
jgi:hypothetical protein